MRIFCIRFLLLGIAISYVIFNAGVVDSQAQNYCREFTDDEIRQNIHKYVNVVFGSKSSTLQDYLNFEGEHGEAELTFEIEECVRKGWIPPIKSQECINFARERTENANDVPSYYYNFLRTLVKREGKNLVIHEINHLPQKQENELKTVLVDVSLGEISLQFYHAGDICGVPLGLIMLTKMGDKPISEILKYSKHTNK